MKIAIVYWLLSGVFAASFSFCVYQPGLCYGAAIRKARLDTQLFSCSRVHMFRNAAVQSSSAAGNTASHAITTLDRGSFLVAVVIMRRM